MASNASNVREYAVSTVANIHDTSREDLPGTVATVHLGREWITLRINAVAGDDGRGDFLLDCTRLDNTGRTVRFWRSETGR